MIKNKTVLEVSKNERIYKLELSPESPLGEVFDVLCEMRGFVVDRILQEQKGKELEEKSEEKPEEV